MSRLAPALRIACSSVISGLAAFGLVRLANLGSSNPVGPPVVASLPPSGSATPVLGESAGSGGGPVVIPLAQLADRPEDNDFFRHTTLLFDAIEQLSAADFAGYAAAGKLPKAIDSTQATFFQGAVLEAFVARWFAVDPSGAMGAILKLTARDAKGERPTSVAPLRQALARVQPMALLAAAATLPAEETAPGNWPDTEAFTALARTQPDLARRLASQLPTEQRESAEWAIAWGVAEFDPVAAIKVARERDHFIILGDFVVHWAEKAGVGVLRQLLEAGGPKLGEAVDLAPLVARYPELAADVALPEGSAKSDSEDFRKVVEKLSVSEIQKRLAGEDKIPGQIRSMLVGQLVEAWAVAEPAEAAAWAFARCNEGKTGEGDEPVQLAFAVWREKDWDGALAWWKELPPSALKSGMGDEAALALLRRGETEAALKLISVPQPEMSVGEKASGIAARSTASGPGFGTLVYAAARANPAECAVWLAGQTTEVDLPMDRAVGGWVARDPGAAAEWADALPAGRRRDEAAAAMARALVARDAEAAAEWVDGMAEAAARAKAARSVFVQLSDMNPPAARAWLRARPGLSAEEKEQAIRLGK